MKIVIQNSCPVCGKNRRVGNHTRCSKITKAKHAGDFVHSRAKKLTEHTKDYVAFIAHKDD